LQITGYEPQDLVDKSLYHYVHTQDLMALRWAHQVCKYCCEVFEFYYLEMIFSTHKRTSDNALLSFSCEKWWLDME
jgi:hypothetical protein